jgi:hypothetical protein
MAAPAVSSNVPRRPSEDYSTGNKNAPMNAPSLPTPAEIPCPVVRMSTGYSSLDSTNVVMFRTELGEEIAHPVHQQERGHHGGHAGHRRDDLAGARLAGDCPAGDQVAVPLRATRHASGGAADTAHHDLDGSPIESHGSVLEVRQYCAVISSIASIAVNRTLKRGAGGDAYDPRT